MPTWQPAGWQLLAQTSGQQGNPVSFALALLVPLVIFYFLLWRPQLQQQRRRQQMLKNLKRGDRIVTIGGIHGEITAIKDDTLTVRIAGKVGVRRTRPGVGYVKGKDEA